MYNFDILKKELYKGDHCPNFNEPSCIPAHCQKTIFAFKFRIFGAWSGRDPKVSGKYGVDL